MLLFGLLLRRKLDLLSAHRRNVFGVSIRQDGVGGSGQFERQSTKVLHTARNAPAAHSNYKHTHSQQQQKTAKRVMAD